MLARAICLLSLLLLGGCGVLQSKRPLVARSEFPPELASGTYQPYRGVSAAELREVPDPWRKQCLDWVAPAGGGQAAPAGYCSYDADEQKAVPQLSLARDTRSLFLSVAASARQGDRAELRLQRRGSDLYLVQFREPGKAKGFRYAMLHIRNGALEVFIATCDHFPSIAVPVDELASTPGQTLSSEAEASGSRPMRCEASALEPISADLNRFAADIEAGKIAPAAILKR